MKYLEHSNGSLALENSKKLLRRGTLCKYFHNYKENH